MIERHLPFSKNISTNQFTRETTIEIINCQKEKQGDSSSNFNSDSFKGTVGVIGSNSPVVDWHGGFTTVSFKQLLLIIRYTELSVSNPPKTGFN